MGPVEGSVGMVGSITKGVLAAVAAACLALVGCGPKPDTTAPAPDGPALTVVRFATDWKAQAEHGGFYQAVATGEYAKRGLDVQIIQGGPSVNVPQLLAAGQVDMGLGSNAFVSMNLAQQKAPIRAVMAVFQKDPQVLIAHPDAGVASIGDLKGRPILLSDASVTAFWVWLKAKYGFTDAQVRKYTFNAAPFLADKRAVQQGYVTSEPYTLEKEAGLKAKVFLLADSGYPGYAAMVLAPQSLIDQKPEVVKAFVEGTAAGWASYLHGDPSAADALILKDNPEMKPDVLAQAREKMRTYGIVESGDAAAGGIGAMTDARWTEFFETAAKAVYPDVDVRSAYTLQFVTPAAAAAPAPTPAAPKP